MNQSVPAIVAATLKGMGIAAPDSLIHTFALREGCLVAEKFRYEGGYAIWAVGSDVVQFYDGDGALLKTVAMGLTRSGTAA